MKKIFLIITLLIVNYTYSQHPVLSTTSLSNPLQDLDITNNGNYAVDIANERNQYVGTWEYNNNGTVFQIKIEKQDKIFNGVVTRDVLMTNYFFIDGVKIKYKLIINNQIIYDNLGVMLYNIKEDGFKLGSRPYLQGSIVDKTTNVGVRYEIYKTTDISPQKIIFKPQRGTIYKLNPNNTYVAGQQWVRFPMEEIEMIKIN